MQMLWGFRDRMDKEHLLSLQMLLRGRVHIEWMKNACHAYNAFVRKKRGEGGRGDGYVEA
jgi:hypothetical protein